MKALKILFLLLITSLFSACVSAPTTAVVVAEIVDAETNEPLENAYVFIGNKLQLTDASGKVQGRDFDNKFLDIYAAKQGYFYGRKHLNSFEYPRRNNVIYTTLELYPLPTYPKNKGRSLDFAPSKKFTDAYIENTPHMKEFLTYLLNQGISIYNFTDNEDAKYCIVNVKAMGTKEPIANAYVLAVKEAGIFSSQKEYLFMTNEEGFIDIPVDLVDKLYVIKDGYSLSVHSAKYWRKQKELSINLPKYLKGKKRVYLRDNCLKISKKLLAQYPANKMLQGFLDVLYSQEIILASLPDNEIVDIDKLEK